MDTCIVWMNSYGTIAGFVTNTCSIVLSTCLEATAPHISMWPAVNSTAYPGDRNGANSFESITTRLPNICERKKLRPMYVTTRVPYPMQPTEKNKWKIGIARGEREWMDEKGKVNETKRQKQWLCVTKTLYFLFFSKCTCSIYFIFLAHGSCSSLSFSTAFSILMFFRVSRECLTNSCCIDRMVLISFVISCKSTMS